MSILLGEKEKLEKLLDANGGKYKTIKHLEIRIRNGLENIRVQTTSHRAQVVHHIKQQCLFFLRANRKNPGRFLKYRYFSVAFKNFIIQNQKSKERMRFRNKVNNLAASGCSIERLFAHPDDDFDGFDEYAEMPDLLEIQHLYNRHISQVENSANLERDFINYFIDSRNWRRNITRRNVV